MRASSYFYSFWPLSGVQAVRISSDLTVSTYIHAVWHKNVGWDAGRAATSGLIRLYDKDIQHREGPLERRGLDGG